MHVLPALDCNQCLAAAAAAGSDHPTLWACLQYGVVCCWGLTQVQESDIIQQVARKVCGQSSAGCAAAHSVVWSNMTVTLQPCPPPPSSIDPAGRGAPPPSSMTLQPCTPPPPLFH
jgi:hypothetical protein